MPALPPTVNRTAKQAAPEGAAPAAGRQRRLAPVRARAFPPQRLNFLYFTRFGSTESGPSRRILSSS